MGFDPTISVFKQTKAFFALDLAGFGFSVFYGNRIFITTLQYLSSGPYPEPEKTSPYPSRVFYYYPSINALIS
jgi:hypothetical protein